MKTVTGLLNWRLEVDIGFNHTLHGLRAAQVKGAASLEDNMLQHVMAMR